MDIDKLLGEALELHVKYTEIMDKVVSEVVEMCLANEDCFVHEDKLIACPRYGRAREIIEHLEEVRLPVNGAIVTVQEKFVGIAERLACGELTVLLDKNWQEE
jgi:hypothetical protein